ncbi:MAG: HDOD domain-containing protein [Thiotrichales bacterium]|nr:HDOD domain-containing protein [Thiotrichales bacterium]
MQSQVQRASEILSQITVPTVPEELLLLKEELNRKYPNTVTIANLISHNPELLVNFLTLVNTNITSEKNEIKDAKAAVNLLGLDEIYNIFLSSSITSVLAQSDLEKSILMHGAKAGLASAELSYWVYDISRSEAYMAALMQNIGAVYLSRKYQEEYEKIFNAQLGNPVSSYIREIEMIGTSHCIVGGIISKRWNISPDIYKAILFHHDMNFSKQTHSNTKVKHLTALIILGNYTVSASLSEQYITQELKEYRNAAKSVLELPDNAFKAASAAVQKWGNNPGLVSGSH